VRGEERKLKNKIGCPPIEPLLPVVS
jgi:hypothetical protein